jgi:Flp pilus assembly protein TadB
LQLLDEVEPNDIFFDYPNILKSEKSFNAWVSDWVTAHPEQAPGLQAFLSGEDDTVWMDGWMDGWMVEVEGFWFWFWFCIVLVFDLVSLFSPKFVVVVVIIIVIVVIVVVVRRRRCIIIIILDAFVK